MNPSMSSAVVLNQPSFSDHAIDLAVILPTYNERENIRDVIATLERSLCGLHWELIFVDDDSPDGTADLVRGFAEHDPRIRLLHRIGRRGLSSACIEGILASSAGCVAVMDADLQHDETVLPQMLAKLGNDGLDIVIGTRNAEGGSMGDFSKHRVLLSRLGKKISHAVCRCELTDPMSGFFLMNRSFFLENVRLLHGNGFKILVDLLASSKRPVRLAEVGYRFRNRSHGTSKLSLNTGIEYLFLVVDKLTSGIVPLRFAIFSLVGATGAVTHLACLWLLLHAFHTTFGEAQTVATILAMTENFFVNNLVTYRSQSLRGVYLLRGLITFWIACSFGAWANLIVANVLLQWGARWYLAGFAGLVLSSVWNYSMSTLFTWKTPRPRQKSSTTAPTNPQTGDVLIGLPN